MVLESVTILTNFRIILRDGIVGRKNSKIHTWRHLWPASNSIISLDPLDRSCHLRIEVGICDFKTRKKSPIKIGFVILLTNRQFFYGWFGISRQPLTASPYPVIRIRRATKAIVKALGPHIPYSSKSRLPGFLFVSRMCFYPLFQLAIDTCSRFRLWHSQMWHTSEFGISTLHLAMPEQCK